MIRVKPDRCGYVGYVCEGVPSLAVEFKDTVMACGNVLDNYLVLPIKAAGFVTTLDRVIDMDIDIMYPELECKESLDPFTADGFLDLFRIPYDDKVVARVDGGAWVPVEPSFICAAAPDALFEPGLIEPMLDTVFSNVGIDLNTGIDATLDGILLALALLISWQDWANDVFSKLRGYPSLIEDVLEPEEDGPLLFPIPDDIEVPALHFRLEFWDNPDYDEDVEERPAKPTKPNISGAPVYLVDTGLGDYISVLASKADGWWMYPENGVTLPFYGYLASVDPPKEIKYGRYYMRYTFYPVGTTPWSGTHTKPALAQTKPRPLPKTKSGYGLGDEFDEDIWLYEWEWDHSQYPAVIAPRPVSASTGGSGDTYKGMFKVIKTSPTTVKVIDGLWPEGPSAGSALINDKFFEHINTAEFTVGTYGYVYLISTAGENAPNTPELAIFDTPQLYELGKSKTLISRITTKLGSANEVIIDVITQEQHGAVIGFIDGDCYEDEE